MAKHKIYKEGKVCCGKTFGIGFGCTRREKHTGPHQWVKGEISHQRGDPNFPNDIYTEHD